MHSRDIEPVEWRGSCQTLVWLFVGNTHLVRFIEGFYRLYRQPQLREWAFFSFCSRSFGDYIWHRISTADLSNRRQWRKPLQTTGQAIRLYFQRYRPDLSDCHSGVDPAAISCVGRFAQIARVAVIPVFQNITLFVGAEGWPHQWGIDEENHPDSWWSRYVRETYEGNDRILKEPTF